ncbi:type II toxin-antitoxin system PemK/MazF family toxin [Candidatus Woesearchaeota archaeon]|nr:type II toxin-antitoxin system PemK/MazF family toxin [Candidatus Woesearchaeota archaeon]
MNPGEIWLVSLPGSDGHEQAGTRPALIVSGIHANIVLVIPFTSNVQALRFPHTIKVQANKTNGLTADSIALVFHVRAIDTHRLTKRLGMADAPTMTSVQKELKGLLRL